jgi:flagellin
MREIAIQASNDTNNAQDRGNLQSEMDALVTEIDRIAHVTTWAGNSVMDGDGTAASTKTFSLQVGAATGTKNQIAVAVKSLTSATLGLTASASSDKNRMMVVSDAGTGTAANADKHDIANDTTTDGTAASANTARENAIYSITIIDAAIKTVNTQRSELGAISNRLSHTVSNMTNISTNLSAARGGIEDADFAVETTQLAKNQILQQAGTAMLAQANASKQNVLSLLQ